MGVFNRLALSRVGRVAAAAVLAFPFGGIMDLGRMGSGWWVVPILLSALRVSEARRRRILCPDGEDWVRC